MNGYYGYGYGPYIGQALPQWPQQSTGALHRKLAEAFALHFRGREPGTWLELIDFLLAITVEMGQQAGLPPDFIKQRIEFAFTRPYR